MKIYFRLKEGWSDREEHPKSSVFEDSTGKRHCPKAGCYALLYVNPGGGIYCDRVHEPFEPKPVKII